MCPVPKLPGRSLAATSVAGQSPRGCLFFIHDHINSLRFLVDTGAEVSIIPPSRADRSAGQGTFRLQAVNGSNIATFGVRSLTLNLGLRRTFRWVFIIADIQQPVVGADFLYHFGLLVDMRHSMLVDSTTNLRVHGIICPDQDHSSDTGFRRLPKDESSPFSHLHAVFPAITQACSSDRPVKHTVVHHITTTGSPGVWSYSTPSP